MPRKGRPKSRAMRQTRSKSRTDAELTANETDVESLGHNDNDQTVDGLAFHANTTARISTAAQSNQSPDVDNNQLMIAQNETRDTDEAINVPNNDQISKINVSENKPDDQTPKCKTVITVGSVAPRTYYGVDDIDEYLDNFSHISKCNNW